MTTIEMTNDAPSAGATEQYQTCEECGAPVERTQRYCVICGSRRKHAADPAARFLAGTTSERRSVARAAARGGAPARSGNRRSTGLGTVAVIAAIPLSVAIGVIVGRAGNGTDAKLLAALRDQKAQVVNVGGGAAAGSSQVADASTSNNHKGSSKQSSTGKVLSKTRYGSFNNVNAIKAPSKQQLNRNAQIVNKIQSQINKSYVNSQNNLPNEISVP